MPANGWTTPEERDFLRSFLPEYEACQVKKKYKHFWQRINVDYFARFPVIEKVFPGVKPSELSQSQKSELAAATIRQQQRLKEWYRWQMNPRSRNAGCMVSKKDLHTIYSGRTRVSKPYEVFAKLYHKAVDEEKQKRCEANRVKGRAQLAVWRQVAKDLFKGASEEQKEAVRREMDCDAESDREEPLDSPKSYMRYLKMLPSILDATITPVVKKAGVLALITIVGPSPEQGGKIVSETLQFGDKPSTPLFSKEWSDHDNVFVEELARFARRHEFPPDLCASRSLSNPGRAAVQAQHNETRTQSSENPATPERKASLSAQPNQIEAAQCTSPIQLETPPSPGGAKRDHARATLKPRRARFLVASPPASSEEEPEEDEDLEEDGITLKVKEWGLDEDNWDMFDSTIAKLSSSKSPRRPKSYTIEEIMLQDSPPKRRNQLPEAASGSPRINRVRSSSMDSSSSQESSPARDVIPASYSKPSSNPMFTSFISGSKATNPSVVTQDRLFKFSGSNPNWLSASSPSPSNQGPSQSPPLANFQARISSANPNSAPTKSNRSLPSKSALRQPSGTNGGSSLLIVPPPISCLLPPSSPLRTKSPRGSPPTNPTNEPPPDQDEEDVSPIPALPPNPDRELAPRSRVTKSTKAKTSKKAPSKPITSKEPRSKAKKVLPPEAPADDPQIAATSEEPTRRRSARGSVPSKREAQLQLIGSNATQAARVLEKPIDSDAAWFTEALTSLQSYELGEEWSNLVKKWESMERMLGQGHGTKGHLPVEGRPEEWQRWTSKSWHGVRAYGKIPSIDDPAEFGFAVAKWWSSIQPSFRASGDAFPLPIYFDPNCSDDQDTWAHLRQGGQNGFVSIVIMMAWWGYSTTSASEWQEDSLPAWKSLVADISVVLDRILDSPSVNAPSSKRPLEKENAATAGPSVKKRRKA